MAVVFEAGGESRRDEGIEGAAHLGEGETNAEHHLHGMRFTESSLALNQLLISVFCDACSTSPPIPNTTLPIIITTNVF